MNNYHIKPQITLLFLLSVFTVLLIISAFFYIFSPEGQSGFVLGNSFKISFFNPTELFSKTSYKDISEIIEDNEVALDSTATFLTNIEEFIETENDTIRANADSLRESLRKLEFSPGKRNVLFPVFQAMDSAKKQNKVVRVMHYGDSQIEGDRMTSFIRNKLQTKFGGKGVGLVPARQMYDFKYSVYHEASENWYRYTVYGNRDTNLLHNRYGILASFNSFTSQPLDSNQLNKTHPKQKAWISFNKSPFSFKNTQSFDQCRLFYGYNQDTFKIKLFVNNEPADSGKYPPVQSLKNVHWKFTEPIENIELDFEAGISPEIYGIALDGINGVAVDNIAMRGCAGLVFTKMDPKLFKQLVKELDVKLMILQFGGNIVPTIRKNYDYYERWFYSQLNYIRTNAPGVEIIVIGVADMSMKKGSRYVSYPNIELVRDAMKKATFRAGAVYWDMYEAMGGENSMPSWVFANPSLAGKDFVHFNPRGSRIIANMFYNALMHEYSYYKRQTKNQE